MPDPAPHILRLVTAYKAEWQALVEHAVLIRAGKEVAQIEFVSEHSKKSSGAVAAKLNAILGALASGMTPAEITEKGEKEILSMGARNRSAGKVEGTARLSFNVPGSQKDAVLRCLDRWSALTGCQRREDALDLWLSVLDDRDIFSDDAIRHLAGGAIKK